MAAGKLCMVCFEARTAAHILHLKTRSYAAHKALDEFYHGIIDAVDAFVEAWQGVNGLIEDYPSPMPLRDEKDPVVMIARVRKWLVSYRNECCGKQTELENLYDEIIELCDSTRYKLKFLS